MAKAASKKKKAAKGKKVDAAIRKTSVRQVVESARAHRYYSSKQVQKTW